MFGNRQQGHHWIVVAVGAAAEPARTTSDTHRPIPVRTQVGALSVRCGAISIMMARFRGAASFVQQ